MAKDSSGKGNDLVLSVPPQRADAEIKADSNSLHTGGEGGGTGQAGCVIGECTDGCRLPAACTLVGGGDGAGRLRDG